MGVSRTIRKSFEFGAFFSQDVHKLKFLSRLSPWFRMQSMVLCVYLYGSNWSGKTFTMMGPEGSWGSEIESKQKVDVDVDDSLYGVAPRAVIELFEIQKRLKGK